jgi:hypothetical protein
MTSLTFKVEDIFESIPGDEENVIMKFPPEVLEEAGWKEGDMLNIEIVDNTVVVTKA